MSKYTPSQMQLISYPVQSNGQMRAYSTHVPANVLPLAPVVIGLHGSFSTAKGFSGLTNLNAVLDTVGWIGLYPESVGSEWNIHTPPSSGGTDEVAFFRDMLTQQDERTPLDWNHIHMLGMSNGAMETAVAAIEMQAELASIGLVAGCLDLSSQKWTGKPTLSMPVCKIHGKLDPTVPYDGSKSKYGIFPPALTDAAMWAAAGNWQLDPIGYTLPDETNSPAGDVILQRWLDANGNAQVEFYSISNGGHTWPSGVQYAPVERIGITSTVINASQTLIDFFARHPRGV